VVDGVLFQVSILSHTIYTGLRCGALGILRKKEKKCVSPWGRSRVDGPRVCVPIKLL
jgi:hypothetical protein